VVSLTIDGPKNVTATFAVQTFPVDVTTTGSGSVVKNPDFPGYAFGSTVQLTAQPSTGWHFLSWSGDLTGNANPDSVVVDGAKSVNATFAINTYSLSVTVSGSGTVARSPNQAAYTHGTVV